MQEIKRINCSQWSPQMGCVSSRKVPDVVGEGYRLKFKKTLAVGGSANIMEVDPGGGKATMVLKKVVAFTKREEERVKLEAELYKRLESNEFVIDLVAHIVEDVNHYLLFNRYSMNLTEFLEKIRKDEEPFDESRHLRFFAGIVSAIEHLHSLEYAHFDLKPANVMISGDTIKLIDFGSATKMPVEIRTSADHHRHKEDAEELCSMMYRAPELFSCEIGSRLTTAVDIWALGVCLYEFMFLENPFNKVYEQGGSIALAAQSPQMIKWSSERKVDEKTIDLMKEVLKVDPEERPNAERLRKKVEELRKPPDDVLAKDVPTEDVPLVDVPTEDVPPADVPLVDVPSEEDVREITDEEFDMAMREEASRKENVELI